MKAANKRPRFGKISYNTINIIREQKKNEKIGIKRIICTLHKLAKCLQIFHRKTVNGNVADCIQAALLSFSFYFLLYLYISIYIAVAVVASIDPIKLMGGYN